MFNDIKQRLAAVLLISFLLLGGSFVFALAQTQDSTTSTDEGIASLQEQVTALLVLIEDLQTKIADLKSKQGELRVELAETKLELRTQLKEGLTSEEVTLLQEILATDPDIYPEGLVTGFFGPLTAKAVKKFQEKHGIEQVGEVGPKTRAKINAILSDGVGNSGKVPPGLLIAPGIAKKLGESPEVDEALCAKLPKGIAKKIPNCVATGGDGDTNEKPVITLIGDNSLNLTVGDTYTDEGATATDPEDGDIMEDIVVGGDGVDTSTAGTYTVTYNVVDSESLAADEVTREIVVTEADTTSPAISGVAATSTTASSTTIVWDTDEEADSKVTYGTSTPVTGDVDALVVSNSTMTMSHSVDLTDLSASTTYYYTVTSEDSASNSTTGDEQLFTTLE